MAITIILGGREMYLDNRTFITREEAINKLIQLWKPQSKTESVPLREALNRVCAADMYSKNTLPVCRSSKLDGIAVRFSDFENGMPDTSGWEKGTDYVTADTGDDFDDNFDTVIAVESVRFDEDGGVTLKPGKPVTKGQNIKGCGENIREGELLVKSGTRLNPIHLCLLATGGIDEVEVEKRPIAAYIPTGDELIQLGEKPLRGQNIESNSLMIEGLLKEWGAEYISYPIIKDNKSDIDGTLVDALNKADIVLINGGSSKGSEDYASKLLQKKASFLQHGIRAIPGIPVSVSIVGGKPVINLPGPSLAAFYAMDWCVQALVYHQLRLKMPVRQSVKVVLQADINKPVQHDFYVRLKLVKAGEKYEANVLKFGDRFAELISDCNAIMVVPIGITGYKKGQVVEAQLLYGESVIPVKDDKDDKEVNRLKRNKIKVVRGRIKTK